MDFSCTLSSDSISCGINVGRSHVDSSNSTFAAAQGAVLTVGQRPPSEVPASTL